MTDMIERVARALCEASPLDTHRNNGARAWKRYIPQVRAALKAIREPTDEMIDMVISHVENWDEFPVDQGDQAISLVEAMIDTALKRDEPKP